MDPNDPAAVLGIYGSASRQKVLLRDDDTDRASGPFVQVSRLANRLFNEVLVPLGQKDIWNSREPRGDEKYLANVQFPEVAKLLPILYPGVFPNLAALQAPRADLVAILLTGIPAGIVPGFQNFSGPTYADLLRLNVAIPPAKSPNILGVVGGDLAGFPNGRRVFDDVITVELRAIAGLTYPLVALQYVPDGAASAIQDGTSPADVGMPYLKVFPYLGVPLEGYSVPAA